LAARRAEAPECNPPAFTREPDGLYVSSHAGLGGAIGLMVAICLEAAAILVPLAIWLILRGMR
jgi:hypothetical protein